MTEKERKEVRTLIEDEIQCFGICDVCNKPIPVERIKSIPTANRCVSCEL